MAVARFYYPEAPDELRRMIHSLVDEELRAEVAAVTVPLKAVIAPHAGYQYCGPSLAQAYRALARRKCEISRVIVLGPAHRSPLEGIALSSARYWETPLGDVEIDTELVDRLRGLPGVVMDDDAHAPEHSIEVHMPMIREVIGNAHVVPVLVGRAEIADVARVIDAAWCGDETVIVVSSDLSHYLAEDETRRRDEQTSRAIVDGRVGEIGAEDACGWRAVAGFSMVAATRGLTVRSSTLTTSADTIGNPRRAVGYGCFTYARHPSLASEDFRALADIAVAAVRQPPTRDVASLGARVHDRPGLPFALRAPGASFVTVHSGGKTRGCQGSVRPIRPLWLDVAENAQRAAFYDRRYEPLGASDAASARVTVSVLSPLEEIPASSAAEVAAAICPEEHGLVVAAESGRATFLPTVWQRHPGAEEFVLALGEKASWGSTWPETARAWRYTTAEITRVCDDTHGGISR